MGLVRLNNILLHRGRAPVWQKVAAGCRLADVARGPDYPGAGGFIPKGAPLEALGVAVQGCQGCDLYGPATQAVWGSGGAGARVVLVGEQPGDVEDQRGVPFVGPAGKLLDRALAAAGIDREQTYVTNAVKHFKHTVREGSKRRMHATPDTWEVAACKPWLEAELNRIRPELVVLLGATAAKALLGNQFRVTQQRGVLLDGPRGSGAHLLATIHPSAVLRAPDTERDAAFQGLVDDLTVAAGAMQN